MGKRIFETDAESAECGPPTTTYAALFRDLAEMERQVRRISLPMSRLIRDRNERGAAASQARETAKVINHIASILEVEGGHADTHP